jgi:16S rRNA (uracil1498-N3)-methyltransferase
MTRHRFFVSQPLELNKELALESAVSRHINLSLRLGIGEYITLFNGREGEYSAQVIQVTKKCVTVVIDDYCDPSRESTLNVHLAIVMTRGDRMDYSIQKATELGVTRITPLYSERCEVKLDQDRVSKKLSHWQHIVASACEQCGRNIVPVVETPVALSQYLARAPADLQIILDPGGASLPVSIPTPASINLLNGPEGGFSSAEVALAEHHGYQSVKLGPRILRAETAAVVGLSLLQSIWGDL